MLADSQYSFSQVMVKHVLFKLNHFICSNNVSGFGRRKFQPIRLFRKSILCFLHSENLFVVASALTEFCLDRGQKVHAT